MKEIVERRQYNRFQVPASSAYAVVKRHWTRSPLLGDIVDISRGGLSFLYVAKDRESYISSHLDILLTEGTFHLDKLPLRTVSDLEVESETPVGLAARRCSVQFGDLTDEQALGIVHFIQTCTTADPES